MPLGPLLLAALSLSIPAEPGPPASDTFVATSPLAEPSAGTLTKFSPDGTAELATPKGVVKVHDAISLTRATEPPPPFPYGPLLITTTGDRIPGRLLGGDSENLRFRPSFSTHDWSVPITAVKVVWVTGPPAATPINPTDYSWLANRPKRDVLQFRNKDVLAGTLDGFVPADGDGADAESPRLRFKPDAGETRTVSLMELSTVAFNPSLARARKPKGPSAHLVLRDGTRLDVTGATIEAETLRARTLFGQSIEVPVADLVSLSAVRGKATLLGELKPKKVESGGFLGPVWPWAADRTVRGDPLRLLTPQGEGTFDRGLGTHPRTTLTYTLDGKYRRFEALVGLDPVSGKRGQAAVRILVDGKEHAHPKLPTLSAGLAIPVSVDVRNAKELVLVVDFGPTGDVQADVNWANARLVTE